MIALSITVILFGFACLETGRIPEARFRRVLLRYLAAAGIAGGVYALAGNVLMYGEHLLTHPVIMGQSRELLLQDFLKADHVLLLGALVFSGIAGRILDGRRLALCCFLYGALIYPVFGRWTWGGGWLDQLNFEDISGATLVLGIPCWFALGLLVMHVTRPGSAERPVSGEVFQPLFFTGGAGLTWLAFAGLMLIFLWTDPVDEFDGFLRRSAGIATNLAFLTGAWTALGLGRICRIRPRLPLAWCGGLAGIAAAHATTLMAPVAALGLGMVAGLLAAGAVWALRRLRLPDELDFIAAFGIGGAWGTFAAGAFASPTLVPQLAGLVQAGVWAGAWGMGLGWLLGWWEERSTVTGES